MRWLAVVCAVGACIKADPPVVCGERICPPGSVCLGDGTCAIPPTSPTKFVLDNRASRTDLVEMPLLVTIDPSTIDYSQVADPKRDVGFRAAGSDLDLPFEIERWDPTGQSLVWTVAPTVAAASNTDAVVMYFGPDANRLAAPSAMLWKDYELVVHGTSSFESSAAPVYPAQPTNVTLGPAMLGDGIVFPASLDGTLAFGDSEPLFDGWSQFSFAFWLYADYDAPFGDGEEARTIGKDASGSLATGRLYQYTGLTDVLAFQIDVRFASGETSYEHVFIEPQTWTHLAYTFDGQVLRIFRDGTLAGVFRTTNPDVIGPDPSELRLGYSSGSLHGVIDELRVSKHALTPDEVRADYLVQSGLVLRAR